MTVYRRSLAERLGRVEDAIGEIRDSIMKIEVATLVREPASGLAVDAYEGLRRQVVAAAGDRTAHLYQLARFAQAVSAGTTVEELAPLIAEWLDQAGVEAVPNPADDRYYDVLGGEGDELRVLRAAYRDRLTERPIVMGKAERFAPVTEEVAP